MFCRYRSLSLNISHELVYQELIAKLFPQSGLYFAHGQNKQTLAEIAALYRDLGINYEVIIDFDVLRVSSELSSFLNLMPMDEKHKQHRLNGASQMRQQVNNSVNVDGLSEKDAEGARKAKRDEVYHKLGVAYFADMRERILSTLEAFSKNHLHVLQTGKLETILIPYGVPYQNKRNG